MSLNKAPRLPVWFLRISRGKITWSTTQAGVSAEDAQARYIAGYSLWGVDISDYKILSITPASAAAIIQYYKDGKEIKSEPTNL